MVFKRKTWKIFPYNITFLCKNSTPPPPPIVAESYHFFFLINKFSIIIISPWNRTWSFISTWITFTHWCFVLSKIGWNWVSSSWEEIENVKVYRQTNRCRTKSVQKGSGELKKQEFKFFHIHLGICIINTLNQFYWCLNILSQYNKQWNSRNKNNTGTVWLCYKN